MTSTYTIEEPRTLASLPRPFKQGIGTTRGGLVHGYSGSRKRKRDEIAVGVDGEVVNVYEIHSSKLVTSHSIPPQASLTCAPTCSNAKLAPTRSRKRCTYAAIRTDLDASTHKLFCYAETLSEGQSSGRHDAASVDKTECDIGSKYDPVVYIESIPGDMHPETSKAPHLLAVSKRGELEVRGGDLRERIASYSLSDNGAKPQVSVEHVCLQSSAAARSGLLRERQDLAASMDPTSETLDSRQEPELIVVVTRPTSQKRFHSEGYALNLLTFRRQYSETAQRLAFHLFDKWRLPGKRSNVDAEVGESCFSIDGMSGIVYELCAQTMTIYEPSVTPRMSNRFQLPRKGKYDMQLVQNSAMLLSCEDQCYIYDTKFGTLQAALGMKGDATSRKIGRKRKRSDGAKVLGDEVRLLGWYPKLRSAVALMGRDLVCFQVTTSRKKGQARDTLLIDSMGKNHLPQPTTPVDQKRAQRMERLDLLLSTKKLKEFERRFFDIVGEVEVGNPLKLHHDQAVALKALAGIFDWNYARAGAQKAASIRISCLPHKVMHWIIEQGHLSPGNINKALYDNKHPSSGRLPTVAAGDMISALATHDRSLSLLAKLIKSSRLSLEAWVESLRYLISSFQTPVIPRRDHLLLTNGTEPPPPQTNGDVAEDQTNGTDANMLDPAEEAETSLARTEINLSLSLLEPTHAELRSEALRTCLSHLSLCFASTSLVSAFRLQLSRSDLVLLVDLLRTELSSSGWTSHRLDYRGDKEAAFDQADEAIHVIAKLLNVCVDALGIGGWLSMSLSTSSAETQSGDMDTATDVNGEAGDDVIAKLREATSNTLEAAQESAFFANFLTDFVRYHAVLQEAQRVEQGRQNGTRGPGGSALLYGAGDDDGDGDGPVMQPKYTHQDGAATITRPSQPSTMPSGTSKDGSSLPLGGIKSAGPVAAVRIDAGGEIRTRSARDIARKMSRRVGVYEFEKLDFR